MAITAIDTEPAFVTLGYQQLVIVCTSDDYDEAKFRYVFDIYVDGTKVSRVRTSNNPSNKGIIDVAPIIQSYLEPTYYSVAVPAKEVHRIPDDTGSTKIISKNTSTLIRVQVRVGQEYAASATAAPGTPTFDSGDYVTFDTLLGSHQFNEGLDWNFLPKILDDSTDKFLSNAPTTQDITTSDFHTMALFNGQLWNDGAANPSEFGNYNINYYTAADVFIRGFNITNNTTNGGDAYGSVPEGDPNADKMMFIGVGYQNLEKSSNSVVPALDKPSAQANLAYYTVGVKAGGTARSELLRFNIVDADCVYPLMRLTWLNRYGAWDYFNFSKRSTRMLQITRDEYTKQFGTWAGTTYSYAKWERGRKAFNIQAKEQVVINTDYISEANAAWLEELLTSPDVYLMDTDNSKPIIITNSSYAIKTVTNDKLIQYTITFEYAHGRRLQTN